MKHLEIPLARAPAPALQWGTVLDELFSHVVPHLSGGPRAPRHFPASEDARTCIQMLTAAVLQMIQVGLGPQEGLAADRELKGLGGASKTAAGAVGKGYPRQHDGPSPFLRVIR